MLPLDLEVFVLGLVLIVLMWTFTIRNVKNAFELLRKNTIMTTEEVHAYVVTKRFIHATFIGFILIVVVTSLGPVA